MLCSIIFFNCADSLLILSEREFFMAEKKSIYSGLDLKQEQYERRFDTLNASRFSFGFRLFRGHFSRMVLMNLIMLVSIIPLIYLYVVRFNYVKTQNGVLPTSANVAIGYLPFTSLAGAEAKVTYIANVDLFKFLPLAVLPFGVALAGSLYIVRNILWLEDVKFFKDFWQGIKKNWIVIAFTFLIALIISLCMVNISYNDYYAAIGEPKFASTFTNVLSIIAIILFSVIYLNACVMTVTYRVKFFGLLKNSFLISVILSPIHAIMLIFAVLPFLFAYLGVLLGGGLFLAIGLVFVIAFGFSYFVLVWSNYSHWIYEKFLPAPLTRKPESAIKKSAEQRAKIEAQINYHVNVKPFDEYDKLVESLPSVFTIKDIDDLNDSKNEMKKESDEFVKNLNETK